MPDPDPFALVPLDQVQLPTQAPQPAQPEAKPLTIGDRAADFVDSVNSGIGAAAHEVVDFGAKAVGTLVQGGERLTKPLVEAVTGVGYDTPLSDDALLSVQEWNRGQAEADGSTYQSKTVVGGVSQGITQFLTGFATVGAGLKAAKALQGAGPIVKAAITGAAADTVAFDPHAARLSDLVEDFADKHPTLRNPITEYLSADPSDPDSLGRLKNAMEGLVAGAVLEKTLRALGATKKYLTASRGDRAKAEQVLAKEAEELEKAAAVDSEPIPNGQKGGQSSEGTQGIPQKEIVDSTNVPTASKQDPAALEAEVIEPELGIEKASRLARERVNLTGDEFEKLAEEAAQSESKLANEILGPDIAKTWTSKELDETWIEKQIDAGRVPGIAPNTPYDQWWEKVKPLFMGDSVKDLRKTAREIHDIEASQSAEELGGFLGAGRLYDFMSALRKQSTGEPLLFGESEAITIYNTIQRTAAKNGWDLKDVNRGMYDATFAAGYKPDDIADLLGNTTERLKAPKATDVSALDAPKALEAPVAPKAPDVVPEGDLSLKPDESVNFSKDNPNQSGAPLLPQADKDAIQDAIKNNPQWETQGFINLKGSLFNLSKWDGPDAAKLAVEEVAKRMPSPGSRSLKELEEAARDTGINVIAMANSGKVAVKDISKTVIASKMVIQSMARDITELSRKIQAFPEGDAARVALKAEFDKNIQKLTDTIAFGKTLQTEAARATTAGRIRTSDALSEDELRVIAQAGGDVSTLTQVLKEKPLWMRNMNVHNQLWINGLLSSPITHARNIISNSINTMMLPAERMLGGIVSGVKKGDWSMTREGVDLAFGLAWSIKDAIKLSARSMGIQQVYAAKGNRWAAIKNSGQAILDPGNQKLASTQGNAPALSTDNYKSLQDSKAADVIVNGFGQLANIPSRFLAAEDEFFKQINYRAHVMASASASARKLGLRGADRVNYIARRLEESMDDHGAANIYRTDGIYTIKDPDYDAALEYARRATFTQKAEARPGDNMFDSMGNSLTQQLETASYNHPYLKLVVPFVRTPVNILKSAGVRTPAVNLLSKRYRDALTGKLGERAAADARGQFAVGSALWLGAVTLAYEGHLTGKGPKDPKERAILMASGWQPYSFKVGNKYVSFQGFDPYAMFFGLAADYTDTQAHLGEEEKNSLILSVLTSVANNVTSKSYLTGLTQVAEAITAPESVGEAFLKSRMASYVPSGLKPIGGMVGLDDPYMRETRSYMDAILNRIPGFSETLPPKRNVFGEPITARQGLGPDSISPFFTSTQSEEKAKLELARLGRAFGAPAVKINGIDLTQVMNAKGQSFYDRWQEKLQTYRSGHYTLKERLEALVTSPQYAKWRANEADALESDAQPRTLTEVRAIITEYRERAKQDLIRSNEFPQMAGALKAQQQVQVRARAGTDISEALKGLLNFNNQ